MSKNIFLELLEIFNNNSSSNVPKIDSKLIKQIILKNDNPFKYFYNYAPHELNRLFEILYTTVLLFFYFDKYELYNKKTPREKESLSNKYQSVIDDLKYALDDNIVNILENRMNSLKDNIELTEHSIKYSFAYQIINLIDDYEGLRTLYKNIEPIDSDKEKSENKPELFKPNKPYNPTPSKIDIVNQIMKDYFELETKFSEKINLKNYKEYFFYFESQSIVCYMNKH